MRPLKSQLPSYLWEGGVENIVFRVEPSIVSIKVLLNLEPNKGQETQKRVVVWPVLCPRPLASLHLLKLRTQRVGLRVLRPHTRHWLKSHRLESHHSQLDIALSSPSRVHVPVLFGV